MIDDEISEALAAFVEETGVIAAKIVIGDEPLPPRLDIGGGPPAAVAVSTRLLALGGGEHLHVTLAAGEPPADLDLAFEHVVRQLRAIRRRWEVAQLPAIGFTRLTVAPSERVHDRIVKFLQALAAIDRSTNAFLTRDGKLVASARDASDGEDARWPFLSRRVLGARSPNSSHGEVVDPDAYAMTFWYGAALIVLLAEPYAVDFVRHRCRQVARELCDLLPMLDPDPDAPAAIGPRPRPPTRP